MRFLSVSVLCVCVVVFLCLDDDLDDDFLQSPVTHVFCSKTAASIRLCIYDASEKKGTMKL